MLLFVTTLSIALINAASSSPTHSLDKRSSPLHNVDHLLTLENELDSNLQPFLEQEMGGGLRSKRAPFNVDFMGMRVSYPQYLRLTALQEKVIKLDRLIKALQIRYSPSELERLPQYARLVSLHQSLTPLLPQNEEELQALESSSGSPFTVQFMDMQVSYPQYLRLVALQEKVIKLDQLIRKMRSLKSLEELEKMPQWHRLISLHGSLKKLLPADYLVQTSDEDVQVEPIIPEKRSGVEFNGVRVSLPQYLRLMELQEKVLKLDTVLRKLSDGVDAEKLAGSSKWNQLVTMRQSLQKLLPEGHPDFAMAKRAATMDFNGVQVSYPQYVHLMNLQKKVMALDAAMKKIAATNDPNSLDKLPTWQKLVDLRTSLAKLMPEAGMSLDN